MSMQPSPSPARAADATGDGGRKESVGKDEEEAGVGAEEFVCELTREPSQSALELFESREDRPNYIELCVNAHSLSLDERNPPSTCCVLLLRRPGTDRWKEHARTEVVHLSNHPRYATWLQIPLPPDAETRVDYWYGLQIVQISST